MSHYFRSLPAQVDLPALEREVLDRWRDGKIFERSLQQSEGRPTWVFYDGPPTANGIPGVHHTEARVFKDLFPRYKTMRGFHVPRKPGWDSHGLPVEVAVEKELGLTGKKDIERYGIAAFNERCRESVLRHVDEFEKLTDRLGQWIDLSQAYKTMDPEYIDSVWWSLKVIADKGLLYRDYRVTPYCPRCGTPLSDHELGQPGGYEEITSPSVYVRMPVTAGPLRELGASLLIWTTTPWTLVSNTAIAVHPDVTYVAAKVGDEVLVVAEPLLGVLGEGAVEVARFTGKELERTPYSRPFDLVDIPDAHYVVLADYVTVEDGTGLVHQAPAFGADDMAVSRRYGLPIVNPVGPDGRFLADVPVVGGVFFKDADEPLIKELGERGLLYRVTHFKHSYPHCWRCHTPLLYYAVPTWYIKTTAVKEQLLAQNEKTTWYPENLKWGRFGEWLRNNVDWSLSRSRYWGTPLPAWVCTADDSHVTVVGSRKELGERAGMDLSDLDPHRPFVDEITFPCPECGAPAHRVPDVIDAWYDSGSMPFAQWGSMGKPENMYPAQFIAEGIDQTRGWFYSLMAIGTLLFGESPYQNVLGQGLLVGEDGRKMSKHLGNVMPPIPVMDQHGADALRWFMAASGSPWAQRRLGHAALEEIVRKVLLTYWNTASFFVLYANAESWSPSMAAEAPAPADRPLIDRWALAELHRTVREVTEALDVFDTTRAGKLLSDFLDNLSNWYVRRSRRRFWAGDVSGFATLYGALATVTKLLAPITPFLTDYLWDVLRGVDQPASVHLATWPEADEELLDPRLLEQMALVRRLVELGRAARASSGVKTRQPLGRALLGAAGWADLSPELRALIADELNVAELDDLSGFSADLVSFTVKPNFRALGKRFGPETKLVAAAITAADPAGLATGLRTGAPVSVTVETLGEVALGADEVIVTEQPKSGWSVESGSGETVALDLTITDELRRAGLLREVIRLVQEARKATGLAITDRIDLFWTATAPELAESLRAGGSSVGEEVLAASVTEGTDPGLPTQSDAELGLTFQLRRA